jgi:hypothetical protein
MLLPLIENYLVDCLEEHQFVEIRANAMPALGIC